MFIPGNRIPDIRPIGPDGSFLTADSAARYGTAWRYLYSSYLQTDFSILSFTTPTGVYLAGKVVTNPTFNITYNAGVSGAIIISGTGIQSVNSPFTSHTFLSTASGIPDQVMSFTLTASGYIPAGTDQATTGWVWRQMEYWGAATGGVAASYNSQFIKNLSNSGYYNSSRYIPYSVNTSGHFAFYAYRNGPSPIFKDSGNNLIGGFTLISTGISFTNSANYTESYSLYQSDFPQIGNPTIQVYY